MGGYLPEAAEAPDPSVDDHYQGIARYPGTGTPVVYVTQKDVDNSDDQGGTAGGYMEMIRLGSRGTDGERLRSNLQSPDANTKFTPPPAGDTGLRSFRFNGVGVTVDGRKDPVEVWAAFGRLCRARLGVEPETMLRALQFPCVDFLATLKTYDRRQRLLVGA